MIDNRRVIKDCIPKKNAKLKAALREKDQRLAELARLLQEGQTLMQEHADRIAALEGELDKAELAYNTAMGRIAELEKADVDLET